jgi:hypothetical protein
MKRLAVLLITLVGLVTACSGAPAVQRLAPRAAATTVAAPTPAAPHVRTHTTSKPAPPIRPPQCPSYDGPSPHFATPAEAMRYLATAWNANDWDRLCFVTNPDARFQLADMHREAVHLRFTRCSRGVGLPRGTLLCHFRHDYPKRMHRHGIGHAVVDVAPADTPGWYMTVVGGCG